MVTITAPGVEINEIDLSQYDFPAPKEETQNVLITGFASKGHHNVPYTFTNKNSDSDLIDTFGAPTNEAERYFFNACSEAIKRNKVVLLASRLPYDNEQGQTFNAATYKLDTTLKPVSVTDADIMEIVSADSTLSDSKYINIENSGLSNITDEDVNYYRTGVKRVGTNQFIIVDKNQEIYDKVPVDASHMDLSSRYLIGVLPIVTTAANALYFQKLINADISRLSAYESISAIESKENDYSSISSVLVYPASSEDLDPDNKDAMTLAKYAAGYFPTINIQSDGTFDRTDLKKIGVVVFKGYVDSESGNKLKYEPIESFAGSLNSTATDPTTGKSLFIDDIINTNSKTIEFYSNCFNTINKNTLSSDDNVAFFHMNNDTAYILGFPEMAAAEKKINYSKILKNLDYVFEKTKDRDEKQIDLVVDAGMSNIAQFNKTVNCYDANNKDWLNSYDPIAYESEDKNAAKLWQIYNKDYKKGDPAKCTDTWALVLKKYDAFCKLRGDCMFIADGLRPLCITGNRKIVTKLNYESSVQKSISPFMKYITGKVDTSYGCGNCDWYQIVDQTSGVNMWMPPSVKTMCAMLDATNNYFYWTVPAGLNYGKMNPSDGDKTYNPSTVLVKDIAFSPTTRDAGDIYTKQWNYAKYYEDDGYCIEGQRTFQSRPTAFDRINVRRLFLYLERKTYNAAKYFIYEGNTAYTRQRLIDAITPYFEDAKINGGLYDYRIQCDDKNNTPDTIDHNELHVKIAIKPTKAIEFIECTFVALRTGASFTEAGMED